jgi:hypothetical protein
MTWPVNMCLMFMPICIHAYMMRMPHRLKRSVRQGHRDLLALAHLALAANQTAQVVAHLFNPPLLPRLVRCLITPCRTSGVPCTTAILAKLAPLGSSAFLLPFTPLSAAIPGVASGTAILAASGAGSESGPRGCIAFIVCIFCRFPLGACSVQ